METKAINESAYDSYSIPEYMRSGIEDYLLHGLLPGSFLTAVLKNNLCEAVSAADDMNMLLIPSYVKLLYNHAPMDSWGSPEIVKRWKEQERSIKKKGQENG